MTNRGALAPEHTEAEVKWVRTAADWLVWAAAGIAVALGLAACAPAASPGPGTSSPPRPIPASVSASGTPVPRPGGSHAAASATIAAVGDISLGTTPSLPPDPATYFDAVRHELDHGAKIVFGNLEGTLTTAATGKCGQASGPGHQCFAFRDPPGYVRYLKDAGFTILNDANNHSFDFGAAGQAQTVRTIRAAGLAQTGLPGEITVARAGRIRVAVLGFAPYGYDASLLDLPAARALIESARQQARVVIVYMHAGAEGALADHVTGRTETYLGEDRGNAEAFAHMAIDSGASLVIASGPHVLRGMQFYKRHLIAYSIGNFASYRNLATDGVLDMSVILHVTLSATGRFERARIFPLQFIGQGQPAPGGGAVAFVARLSAEDFGRSAARFLPSGVIKEPYPAARLLTTTQPAQAKAITDGRIG